MLLIKLFYQTLCSTQVFSQIEANFNLIFLKFFSFFIRLKVKRGFGWGGVFCCWLGFFLVNKISLYFHVLSNHNHNPMLCCSSYSLAVNYAGITCIQYVKIHLSFPTAVHSNIRSFCIVAPLFLYHRTRISKFCYAVSCYVQTASQVTSQT